jgi:hypothetical protein
MQLRIKFLLTFSILLVVANSVFGQKNKSDSFEVLVHQIASANVYEMSYTIGYKGSVSKQHLRFEQLLLIATDSQLLQLASKHTNGVVRLYAYQALKKRKSLIPQTVVQQFKNDVQKVITFNGCIGAERTIAALAELDYTVSSTQNLTTSQ